MTLVVAHAPIILAVATVAHKEPIVVERDGTIRRGSIKYDSYDQLFAEDHTFEHHCGTGDATRDHASRRALLESDCSTTFNNPKDAYAPRPGPLYRIQVAVTVVTNGAGPGAPGYLSEACLADGISLLNNDFRAKAGSKAQGSVDTQIEFVLASADTTGALTSGIRYVDNEDWFNAASGGDEGDALHDAMYAEAFALFPKGEYLNMVTKMASNSEGDGLLGYATFPTSAASSRDGVVVSHTAWGSPEACGDRSPSNNDEGATLTHEVGHYLGLYRCVTHAEHHQRARALCALPAPCERVGFPMPPPVVLTA
jgi:hypothetical protein